MTSAPEYVHGYSKREAERLCDQADALTTLLHHDTHYASGSRVLEAGCGVGAQTVTLARRNPGVEIVAVDRSEPSLTEARRRVAAAGLNNVKFVLGDLYSLDFEPGAFHHVFLCFVLEHVAEPAKLLKRLMTYVEPGGSIGVIEGDHGSTFFHPENVDARRAIDALVTLQARGGGDACIGRRLFPLLQSVGASDIAVSPRFVYADNAHRDLVTGFTLNTFTAMVEGVKEAAIAEGLLDERTFQAGIDGLRRCAEPDGVFCYTFFKATAMVAEPA